MSTSQVGGPFVHTNHSPDTPPDESAECERKEDGDQSEKNHYFYVAVTTFDAFVIDG